VLYASDLNPGADAVAELLEAQIDGVYLHKDSPGDMASPVVRRPRAELPTHFLLYLNEKTFVGATGSELETQLKSDWSRSLPLLMVHERRRGVDFHACDFDKFKSTCSDRALTQELFQDLAHPLHGGAQQDVSMAVICLQLKAGIKPRAQRGTMNESSRDKRGVLDFIGTIPASIQSIPSFAAARRRRSRASTGDVVSLGAPGLVPPVLIPRKQQSVPAPNVLRARVMQGVGRCSPSVRTSAPDNNDRNSLLRWARNKQNL